MKVQFTRSVAARWHDILVRIGSANRFAVQAFHLRVRSSLARIGAYPQSGNPVCEYPAMSLREFIVGPYRFIYHVNERRKLVRIVAIWHGAQLPLARYFA